MRITWAAARDDGGGAADRDGAGPASRWSAFRNMGLTVPLQGAARRAARPATTTTSSPTSTRGTTSCSARRPPIQGPLRAWLLRQRDWLPAEWGEPVLQFLWNDPAGRPARPRDHDRERAAAPPLFRGIGHLVSANGWGPDSTWISWPAARILAEARPPRRGAPRRLPQGLPSRSTAAPTTRTPRARTT